jgi:NitT/TauT family transport system permease protein
MRPATLTRSSATLPVITVLVLAGLWEALPPLFKISPYYFPPLSDVLAEGWRVRAFLGRSILRTFLETLLGFGAGTLFGIACGVAFALSRPLERALFPLFVVSQTIPVVAFGAIVIIWFGNTILAKVVIAFYLTFFPVTVNTHAGILACDPQKIQLMRVFGASAMETFWKLRFPSALPTIAVSLRLGISLSLIGAIVGEWFGDTVGLGVMLIQAMYTEAVPRLWLIILTCGVLGSALYGGISLIERRLIWWRSDA